MKKIGKNLNFKMVAAVALCSFSVVAVAVSTIAWFTAFRSKNSEGGMRIYTPDKIFKKMTIHEINNIDYANVKYSFDKEPIATATYNKTTGRVETSENFTIEMETYTDLEQNHPVLMLVELIDTVTATTDDPITVYASSSNTEYFGAPDETGNPKNTILREGNPLSSVVAFYTKAYTTAEISNASITTSDSYVFPIAELDNTSGFQRETFSTFNDATMEFIGFTQNKRLWSSTTASVNYIAIICDYYRPAIEFVYSTYLSEEVLEDTIYFTCDWSMVI